MTTTVSGISIEYEIKGEGPCVLFLHGWGSSYRLFEGLIAAVSKKYTALALDLPVFGGSGEPPVPWSVDDYCRFVCEFLLSLGLSPEVLIGHSFGGRLMIKLLADNSLAGVKKAVFIDSAGIKPKPSLKSRARLAVYKAGKAVLGLPPIKALFPDALERLRRSRGSEDYKNASPVMRGTLVKAVNEDLKGLLPKIGVPSLLIWGTLDTATPISDGELFESLIPDAGLVRVENGSHYSFLDNPALCIRAISSFLSIPY